MTRDVDAIGARGRPRTFDRTTALDVALRLFWRYGFDGTSIAQLTEAMGIVPTSLYAAFGSKEGLLREAVLLYGQRYGLQLARAVADEATARAAVARILQEAAVTFVRRDTPAGCMLASGMLASGSQHTELTELFQAKRAAMMHVIETRIEKAAADGELPADVDSAELARFYMTVIEGMSVQARDGARRKELQMIASRALSAWPDHRRAA